uniref:Uncharacterized protein n=1 Tax=Magnetococcus massalia (strain MO-1) TaxID=451514 RepID=A0A1S7LME8_MAGMO|nr:protein of unknown function [Candidatus Magnetococcus massalia]
MFTDPYWANANVAGLTIACEEEHSESAQTLALWLLTHDLRPIDNGLIKRILSLVAEQGCSNEEPSLDSVREMLKTIRQARPEWWGETPREYKWDQRLQRLDALSRHTLRAQQHEP